MSTKTDIRARVAKVNEKANADVDALVGIAVAGDTYLSPADAGALLGISAKTIKRWAKADKITERVSPSGRHTFSKSALMALLLDSLDDETKGALQYWADVKAMEAMEAEAIADKAEAEAEAIADIAAATATE